MRARLALFLVPLLVASGVRASPAEEEAEAPPSSPPPLVEVGRLTLAPRGDRYGVRLGHEHFDGRDWLVATPTVRVRRGRLDLGLAPALRFELCRGDVAWAGCVDAQHDGLKPYDRRWTFRTKDWQALDAPLRIVETLRFGEPGDALRLSASRSLATTLGDGGLVRRYQANADPGAPRLPVLAAVGREAASAEALVNDLSAPSLWAARLAFRPLWRDEDALARSVTVSVAGAADARAPLRPRPGADAAGLARPDSAYERGTVSAVSLAVEATVRPGEAWALRPYAEADQLVGAGGGLALGLAADRALARGGARLALEARSFHPNYQPGYFDRFYEAQKFQWDAAPLGPGPLPLTKWEEISARTGPRRWGVAAEASLALPRAISLAAGVEASTAPGGRSAWVHAELPVLSWLQLFGTLHRRSVGAEGWFPRRALDLASTAFVSGARLRLLPFLWLNGSASQGPEFDPAAGRYVVKRTYGADLEIGIER